MRFTIASFVVTLVLASAMAGPVAKIEKKSLVENTKVQKDEPKIEDIGDQKDRSKKSTTTFCVEIRPGTNEAVQTPCACKDKEASAPQSASHHAPQQVPHPAPQQGPHSAPQQVPQPAPQAAAVSGPPSVNIIHALPQQPQTLNIIQPAPTLHAVHLVHSQAAPSAVQNLHILQPAAQLPEPVPQSHNFPQPSKHTEEIQPSEPSKAEIIVKPAEPAPQPALHPAPQPAPHPAPQPAPHPALQPAPHPEHAHKSEVHLSVVTEDKKKEEEVKPQFENIVEPVQKPTESIKIVQVAPIRQPCEEQLVVVPNNMMMVPQPQPCQHSGALIQVPQMTHGAMFQPQGSVYQLPSPVYQQAGPVFTECSCKQTHPASSNLRSMIMPSHMKAEGRHAKIMPMTIVPYPVEQSGKSAVSVHCNPESSSVSAPQSHDSPMIVNMQTVRSKDGMEQGEASDMVQSEFKGARTHSHVSLDAQTSPYYGDVSYITPNMYYDMTPGLQANLYKQPYVKPGHGNHHLYVDVSRNADSTTNDAKLDGMKEMKADPMTPPTVRLTRSDKDTTAKVEEKATEEKKVEEKTSSTKDA